MIPFINLKTQYLELKPAIQARLDRVLEHGQYIMGPEVRELEERLSDWSGAAHCVTVSSGTDALLISLMALGIGPGDEVITTPFTFIATAEVIAMLGAVPVLVDVEADTCNLRVAHVEARITPRTRAIIPVSLYGQCADMDELGEIALRHGGIPVIEDAAQSFGSQYRNRKSGNLSTIGCTSFFPSKPLGCYGDGGAIFTNDESLAQAFREIRVHGQSRRYVHTRVGLAGRMDTLQCAVVLAKLDQFDWEVERRMAIGARYNELIDACGVERVVQRPDRTSVFAQYTVMVDDRVAVQQKLKAKGIPTAVHYPLPINEQPAYRHLAEHGATPQAESLAQRVISLPMDAYLSNEQQDSVVDALCATR
jgi:UDP-2-acetamido-2-deoxy-ribo-hexuluronate aminotransferase